MSYDRVQYQRRNKKFRQSEDHLADFGRLRNSKKHWREEKPVEDLMTADASYFDGNEDPLMK